MVPQLLAGVSWNVRYLDSENSPAHLALIASARTAFGALFYLGGRRTGLVGYRAGWRTCAGPRRATTGR